MNCQAYIPKNELSPYIKYMWILESPKEVKESCPVRIIPTGCCEIIFHFGNSLWDVDLNGKLNRQNDIFVCGQRTKFRDYLSKGRTGVMVIVLNPAGASALLKIPVNELTDLQIDAACILKNEINPFGERIKECASANQKFMLFENFIKTKLCKDNYTIDRRVQEGIRLISDYGGNIKIESLAYHINLSRRQTERLFNHSVGLSPKGFAMILRFQKILALKQKNNGAAQTELALSAGYSDQAHFINEFRSLSGYTPSQYFNLFPAFSDYYSFH